MENNNIQSLRTQIDAIDKSLVELLSKRMELAYEIGREKGKINQPVTVPEREEMIYKSLETVRSRFLNPGDLKKIFSLIIALGRKAGIEGSKDIHQDMENSL